MVNVETHAAHCRMANAITAVRTSQGWGVQKRAYPPSLAPRSQKATLHPHEVYVEGATDGGCHRQGFATRVQQALSRQRACEALLAYR